VKAAFPGGGGRKLLDIGCGDGSFLLGARSVGWQVAGTELNPGPARDAGLEVYGTVEEFAGYALFDCITMWHTLEHMRDIPAMLANIAGLLKPEGRLIIAVPDFGGLQAGLFGPKWLHADVPRHLYHFNRDSLRYSLNTSGFTILRRWHQEIEYDLLGWSQSALNCIQAQPNVFFDFLTGKRTKTGKPARFSGVVLGALLTILSIPALMIGTLMKRGGTLIVVAARSGSDASRTK
jgi:SAM-dependent methyltransferase